MKFYLKSCSNVDVVIFHKARSFEIKKYLLPDTASSVTISPKRFNLNIQILRLFFFNIARLKRDTGFIKFLFLAYQYSSIEYCKPSIVITFIDNSSYFQWLANNYSSARFYAIQNGHRSKEELQLKHKNNLTSFFTFGDYEEKQYREYGHSAQKFIPVGSFLSSIFSQNIGFRCPVEYDICIVSEHKANNFKSKNELRRNLQLIDSYLIRFLTENNSLKCVILCRSLKNSDNGIFEFEYFSSTYGPRVDIKFQDDCDFSTYKGMAQTELIIACYSTSGMEAMGWGKKVLFCDYSPDKRFADFDDGIWLLDSEGYNNFSERVNMVLLLDHKEYKKTTSKYFNSIMKYDDNHSCIDKIKSILLLE